MRGREGGARSGNATTSQHDERSRGQCNERTTKDDDATTNWRDETMRGGMTSVLRGNASASWRDDRMSGRRNKMTRRGDVATSRRD